MDRCAQPIIAAIRGYAFGGGLELALACDIRIAADDAQLGLTEINLAIIPGGGGTQRLPRLVGRGKALEMILTGMRIPAAEALRIGLVERVVPAAELAAAAAAFARAIAEKAPIALRYAKEAVVGGLALPLADGIRLEGDLSTLLRTTEDRLEGAAPSSRSGSPTGPDGSGVGTGCRSLISSGSIAGSRRSISGATRSPRCRFAGPETLRPFVAALAAALRSEERAADPGGQRSGWWRRSPTRWACRPSGSQVLAARPHARWGELHGLYERREAPGEPPLITLWMRTARQKRVVAFRTFLRTLLHEVGHHLDYTGLRLGGLLPHPGLLPRESHLFHQLVTDGGDRHGRPSRSSWRGMERTADDLAAAIARDARRAALEAAGREELVREGSRLPPAGHRGAVPHILPDHAGHGRAEAYSGGEPDRWAGGPPVPAKRRGRGARRVPPAAGGVAGVPAPPPARADWERGGMHPTRGRLTMRDFAGLMAGHDDNHLDQLKRALDGKT